MAQVTATTRTIALTVESPRWRSEQGGGCGLPETLQELELVECGALIAKPGAEHQALHAEYVSPPPQPVTCTAHVFNGPALSTLSAAHSPDSLQPPGKVTRVTPCALALLLACLPRSCAATAAEIS